MRAFWHFNESDLEYVGMLPSALSFCSELTVWAPSGVLIQSAFDQGMSKIDSDDFVDLVESGDLRIAAREDWLLNGDKRKDNRWEGAKWTAEFDGAILRIFEEDDDKQIKRVVAQGPEKGVAAAEQALSERNEQYVLAERLLSEGKVAKGTRQRIERGLQATSGDWKTNPHAMSIKMVIRDAANHEAARDQLGADVMIENDALPVNEISRISRRPPMEIEEDVAEITSDMLKEAMSIVRQFSGEETVDAIRTIRHSTKEQDFLWKLLKSEKRMLSTLASQVKDGMDPSTLWRDVFGDKSGSQLATLYGVGSSLVGAVMAAKLYQNGRIEKRKFLAGIALTVSSFVISSSGPIQNLAERASLIPEPDYSGPSWPTLYGLGVSNANREQLEILYARILEKIEG